MLSPLTGAPSIISYLAIVSFSVKTFEPKVEESGRVRSRSARSYEIRLTCASRLPFDDRDLHVFDLDANEKEINLADDDVLQMILGFVVLELYV
jgi:hypothetical protein